MEGTPRDWAKEWVDYVEEYMGFQGILGFPVSHDEGHAPDSILNDDGYTRRVTTSLL